MPMMISHALLLELHDQLISGDRLIDWFRGRACRRELAAKVRDVLERRASIEAAPYLLEETRLHWSQNPEIRFDERPLQEIDREGVWISAWVHAASVPNDIIEIDPARLDVAVAALPELARDVFRLHAQEGLTYEEIGVRLKLTAEEARQELASALVLLDAALPTKPAP